MYGLNSEGDYFVHLSGGQCGSGNHETVHGIPFHYTFQENIEFIEYQKEDPKRVMKPRTFSKGLGIKIISNL